MSGAFGGEFGGALGVESGELLELGAKGGDLVGEPEVLFIEGAGALDDTAEVGGGQCGIDAAEPAVTEGNERTASPTAAQKRAR